MARSRRNQVAGTVGPFHEKYRVAREVVLPADRENVVGVVQAVEIHVHEQELLNGMLDNEAERWAGDCALRAERGREALRERGLARAEVALQAHDVARLKLGGELAGHGPSLLDGSYVVCLVHASQPPF